MNRSFLIIYFLTFFAPIMVTFMAMPWVVRRNVFFGVSVPPSAFDDPDLKSMRHTYLRWGLAMGSICAIAFGIMYFTMDPKAVIMWLTVMTFALIFAIGILYIIMWRRAKELKVNKDWDEEASSTVVADTSFYRGKIAVSPAWLFLYPLIIGVTLAIGFLLYDKIPARVPMQHDFDGTVTRFADKSYGLIFFAPATQAFLAIIMCFLYWMMRRTRPELDVNNTGKSVKQNTVFRYRWSMFAVFSGVLLMLILMVTQMGFIGIIPEWASLWIPILAPILIVVAVIVLSVTTGQSGSRVKVVVNEEGKKTTFNRNDDAYWRLGSFYVNKNDPAIFVEKRFGVGFTMNFGLPMSWIFLIGILVLTAVFVIITGKLAG